MGRDPLPAGYMASGIFGWPQREQVEYPCAGYIENGKQHACSVVLTGPRNGKDKAKRCKECHTKWRRLYARKYYLKNLSRLDKQGAL